MKKILLSGTLFLGVSILQAAEYCVIVKKNTALKQLTSRQVQNIFLKKLHFLGALKAIPINLLANNKLRIRFEKEVLHLQRDRLNEYWIQQHFVGITPPITQASFESVKLFIQNIPGAIGYIPKSYLDANEQVLYEF